MSCRILGRGIENALLAHLIENAKKEGAPKIVAEFIPTAKNKPCQSFYPDNKFKKISQENESVVYEYNSKASVHYPDFIEVKTA